MVTAKDLEQREAMVREALLSIDHFLAPTECMAEAFRTAGVAPDRITTLCYGLDAPRRAAPRANATGSPPRRRGGA